VTSPPKKSSVCQRAVGEHPIPDYGLVGSVNRPFADPHAGWFGGWGAKPPGYPIRQRLSHWSDHCHYVHKVTIGAATASANGRMWSVTCGVWTPT